MGGGGGKCGHTLAFIRLLARARREPSICVHNLSVDLTWPSMRELWRSALVVCNSGLRRAVHSHLCRLDSAPRRCPRAGGGIRHDAAQAAGPGRVLRPLPQASKPRPRRWCRARLRRRGGPQPRSPPARRAPARRGPPARRRRGGGGGAGGDGPGGQGLTAWDSAQSLTMASTRFAKRSARQAQCLIRRRRLLTDGGGPKPSRGLTALAKCRADATPVATRAGAQSHDPHSGRRPPARPVPPLSRRQSCRHPRKGKRRRGRAERPGSRLRLAFCLLLWTGMGPLEPPRLCRRPRPLSEVPFVSGGPPLVSGGPASILGSTAGIGPGSRIPVHIIIPSLARGGPEPRRAAQAGQSVARLPTYLYYKNNLSRTLELSS
jgi:hypothetical protein